MGIKLSKKKHETSKRNKKTVKNLSKSSDAGQVWRSKTVKKLAIKWEEGVERGDEFSPVTHYTGGGGQTNDARRVRGATVWMSLLLSFGQCCRSAFDLT